MENTVYGKFKKTARENPSAPAIIESAGVLSYREFARMVDEMAPGFPKRTKAVGIIMSHGAKMVAAMMAALKAGAMYVPAEKDFPTKRIHEMMGEAKVDFVLTEEDMLPKLKGLPVKLVGELEEDAKRAAKEGAESLPEGTKAGPESPAYALYTSGTTGRPKGVCVLNRNICHYARAFENEFHSKPGDIMLQYSVCTFDIFVEEVYTTLLNGAALAIPTKEEKKDIESVIRFAKEKGVTIISSFPYLLQEMNKLPAIPQSIRLLISGGDVIRGAYVDKLVDRVTVYNTYGPSETTVCAAYYNCSKGKVLPDGTYPIGKPVKGVEIEILDEEGKKCPIGVTGEICISGNGVSAGYIGNHEEENKAFEKQKDGSVIYRSGDLGYYLPDGNLAFLHRKDKQIMIYGRRVEMPEVEVRLYGCKNVQRAVVRELKDEGGLSYMVAYIVTKEGKMDEEEIRKELAESLPRYMIPEFLLQVEEIPLTENGKTDFEKLPVAERSSKR